MWERMFDLVLGLKKEHRLMIVITLIYAVTLFGITVDVEAMENWLQLVGYTIRTLCIACIIQLSVFFLTNIFWKELNRGLNKTFVVISGNVLSLAFLLFPFSISYMGFGKGAYLALYFGGMIVASLYDLIKRRNDPYYVSIGASGAVSAVLFTSIFLDPWGKILFFAVLPVPGIVFGLLYLAYCQYMAKQTGDNINHNAHFYGAIYGLIFPMLLEPSLLHLFLSQLTFKG